MTANVVLNLVPREEFKISPVQPALGAEVSGVDLKQPLTPELRDAIKAALLKYKVLFFRDQDLTHAEHVAFAGAFGPLYPHPTATGIEGFPEIHRIARREFPQPTPGGFPDRKFAGPSVFHSDTSWRFIPTWGVVLKGVNIPEIGGDTIWVDAEKAYANLSDGFKAELEGKFATHDFREALHKAGKDYPIIAHPIVRTHPETGAKILWVNFSQKPQVLGLSRADSDALLVRILDEYRRPEYQVRLKWRPNTVVFWDNRATSHYAVQDYGDFPREVQRVLIAEKTLPYEHY